MFRSIRAGLMALALLALALGGGACSSARQSATAELREPTRLRVLCYNIRHCRGMDNEVNVERIAAVIRATNPDLVALQEVDVNVQRSGVVDQPAELARLTGLSYHAFGKGRDYQGGDYGQAILSRWPIRAHETHELSGYLDGEMRIAVAADIATPAGMPSLLFVTTHLHHQGEEHRLAQTELLMPILARTTQEAHILTGDLNATPDSTTMGMWFADYVDAAPMGVDTFRSDNPDRKIDYVLLPKDAPWRVVSSEVIDEPMASDHLPIIVELEWHGN